MAMGTAEQFRRPHGPGGRGSAAPMADAVIFSRASDP